MKITYDPVKRERTLRERGLDFEDALVVLSGRTAFKEDLRRDYGEKRLISFGYLRGRMIAVVWTARESVVHVISMRKANDREQKFYKNLIETAVD